MGQRIDGHTIIDSYEAWGVEQIDSEGKARVVEFDDQEALPGMAAPLTARERAEAYVKTFGGKLKQAHCFYSAWEDA